METRSRHRDLRRRVAANRRTAVVVTVVAVAAVLPAGIALAGRTARGAADSLPTDAVFVATTGSDTARGTLRAPFRTVRHALATVRSGGTVVLREGDYREDAGQVRKRVTMRNYPGETPALKGSAVVTGWVRDGTRWRHDGWTKQFCRTCAKASALSAAHPLAGWPDQVFRNGSSLRQVRSASEVGRGEFAVDYGRRAIYVGDDPVGAKMESSDQWRGLQLLGDGAAGSVVDGITFTQYAPSWSESEPGALLVNAPRVTVRNSRFTYIAGTAFGINQPGVRFLDNVSAHNGYRGGNANRAHGLVLDGNTFTDNNTEGFAITRCGAYCTVAGIKVSHSKDVTVSDNVFQGNDSHGFWCDLGCVDVKIVRNRIVDNAGSGIFFEVSSRAAIVSNVLVGNDRGVKVSGSDRVNIWNNTIADSYVGITLLDDRRSASTDNWSRENGLSWDTSRVNIRNNVLSAESAGAFLVDTTKNGHVNADTMIERLDNNAYARSTADRPLVRWFHASGSSSTLRDIGEIRSSTGEERAGTSAERVGADRIFVDEAAGDYRVKRGSVADRAGAPMPSDIAAAAGLQAGTATTGAVTWPGRVGGVGPTTTPSPTPTHSPMPSPPPALTVRVTSPHAGDTVSGWVTVTADASASAGVASVTFYSDGLAFGADTSAPFSVRVDSLRARDDHVDVTAVVRDRAGHTSRSAPVPVTIRR